ncbi:MAG: cell wall hydrolase [Candidatus Daviesbacteria bacterium]|nr:cell wall hydrolase [Candidatus Daviesbacteria bacterium]
MDLVLKNQKKEEIKNKKEINFSGSSGYYLVVISARAKGKQQISKETTDDEDLTVNIDGKAFPKLHDKNRIIDSPASFSGGTLHNLLKTIYFVVLLSGRKHSVILETDKPSNTATLESLVIYRLNLEKTFKLDIQTSAEDGDRRPWVTLALDNLALTSIATTVTYSRRKQDSDDVKIIIDDHVQENLLRNIMHFLWHFVGSLLSKDSSKTETETFTVNLPQDLHYIEFWADRMPTLDNVLFDFGTQPQIPKRIPSVDDPEWTGNFNDDSETMILARAIYGEAGGEPEKAKIAVGWAIRNRIEDKLHRWGATYHEVVLTKYQFEPFNDPNSDSFHKITNPPVDNAGEKKAWEESYKVAEQILIRNVKDPTNGANHFYAPDQTNSNQPPWADENKFIIKIGNTKFYKL